MNEECGQLDITTNRIENQMLNHLGSKVEMVCKLTTTNEAVTMMKSSSHAGQVDAKPPVKRKRRSPAVPWKKPKDMPKRPLSAYNLFFKDERERLLSAGPESIEEGAGGSTITVTGTETGSGTNDSSNSSTIRKGAKIGFANLAKTIAAKWNALDPELRTPYEDIAGREKEQYEKAVAEWRAEQKLKRKPAEAARGSHGGAMQTFPSDRSVGSFSHDSDPYPDEWFNSRSRVTRMQIDDEIPCSITTVPVAASGHPGYDVLTGSSSLRLHSQFAQHEAHGSPVAPLVAQQTLNASVFRLSQERGRQEYNPMAWQSSQFATECRLADPGSDVRVGRSLSMPLSLPESRTPAVLAEEMNRINSHLSELRQARVAAFEREHDDDADRLDNSLLGEVSTAPSAYERLSMPSIPPTRRHSVQALAPPPFPLYDLEPVQIAPRRRSLHNSDRGSRSSLLRPPTNLRTQHAQRHQLSTAEASLRSLSENLDEETINFLTSLRHL